MAANTWAVAILRYSAGVVEWKTDELKVLDRKTRKMMTLYVALQPKSDADRVCMKTEESLMAVKCV